MSHLLSFLYLLGMCRVVSQRELTVVQLLNAFSSHKSSWGRQSWAGSSLPPSRIQSPPISCFNSLSMKLSSSRLITAFPGTMSIFQRTKGIFQSDLSFFFFSLRKSSVYSQGPGYLKDLFRRPDFVAANPSGLQWPSKYSLLENSTHNTHLSGCMDNTAKFHHMWLAMGPKGPITQPNKILGYFEVIEVNVQGKVPAGSFTSLSTFTGINCSLAPPSGGCLPT